MKFKTTHRDRQAFLDRLERKYIKKVQLQAFRRESEQLQRSLNAMRGARVRHLRSQDFDLKFS